MKRMLKELLLRCVSLVLSDDRAKVVYYHDVGREYTPMGTPSDLFWRHMSILRSCPASNGAHRVCFDDGFRGVWNERKKFKEFSIRPIIFIAVRLVGQSGYLTWDEIRELQADYGFDFQCHTWSHQTLVGEMIDESPKEDRTEAWYRRELVESKVEIEKRLGKPIDGLCFPVGQFSDDVIRRCKEAGYSRLYASYPGNMPQESTGLIVPRNLVQGSSEVEFKAILKGALLPLKSHYLKRHYYA